eukprot:1195434-Prorocentrum_minimum.AAC.6
MTRRLGGTGQTDLRVLLAGTKGRAVGERGELDDTGNIITVFAPVRGGVALLSAVKVVLHIPHTLTTKDQFPINTTLNYNAETSTTKDQFPINTTLSYNAETSTTKDQFPINTTLNYNAETSTSKYQFPINTTLNYNAETSECGIASWLFMVIHFSRNGIR